MLLVPPREHLSATRLVEPRSKLACVFTALTWRKSAVCQSGDYLVSALPHSLVVFCVSLSVWCCFVFVGLGFFGVFFLFFWVNKYRNCLLTFLVHCPSATITVFLFLVFFVPSPSLSLTPSLVGFFCCC